MHRFKQFKSKTGSPTLRELDLCKECWDAKKKTSKDSQNVTTGAIFDQISAVWHGDPTSQVIETAEDASSSPETTDHILAACNDLLRQLAIASAVKMLTFSTSAIASECEELPESSQSLMKHRLNNSQISLLSRQCHLPLFCLIYPLVLQSMGVRHIMRHLLPPLLMLFLTITSLMGHQAGDVLNRKLSHRWDLK